MPAPFLHDLTACNSLRLAAHARALVCFRDPAELPALTARVRDAAAGAVVLGGGSNVVLAPRLESLVVRVASRGIRLVDETADSRILEVQAGESWHGLVAHCVAQGWGGLENLALIPGTVGAAPVQNIGAYGVELAERLESVQAWHFDEARLLALSRHDCGFAYRDSLFRRAGQGRWLIVSLRLRLPRRWAPVLDYPALRAHAGLQARGACVRPRDVFDAVCGIRRQKLPDPAVLPNAGSFFKNPRVTAEQYARLGARWPGLVAYPESEATWKLAAGWLIEQAGWKGQRLGPVGMHARQALVLVNHGGAAAHDVARLAGRVQADVHRLFGVVLEQEPVAVS